ncbi:UDP-N-acetylmuramoyl-L-alanine--D-glutamate ligase [Fodinicurvata halophila]|uniref:UDP-N-acetylmuramoylalanine--D-glutamate ligase n=1 Tax=Fodinicurvata halophila TaxID=1419723 RepID=A0ABV8UGI7_9PROT
MIELPFMEGCTVAVLGLGKSGRSAARALLASGAEVWAWDDNEDARARAAAADIPLVDLMQADWSQPISLILSPGIPLHHPAPHPVVAKAEAAGVEVVGDIELLGRVQPDAHYIGVTGTNGKSTTTALIGHVLNMARRIVYTGGNLGTPALEFDPVGREGFYVLEMSSYQLELTLSITFEVAVLLNVSPDHLDRHGGLEGYVAAKKQIFRRQTSTRTAVVGVDDELSRQVFEELCSRGEQRVIPVSGRQPVAGGVYADGDFLVDDSEGGQVPVLPLGELVHLPGAHNWQNAAAAFAACRAAGIEPAVVMACLRSFAGLPHRQELVAEIEGVRFVNDSKATNVDAAARALSCYERIYWIAGGRAKEGGLEGLQPWYPRIVKAFLIGEAAEEFAGTLEGQLQTERSGTLEAAVKAAAQAAEGDEGAVVLLSPACASFDQFANFEERGDAFRALVKSLQQGTAEAGQVRS